MFVYAQYYLLLYLYSELLRTPFVLPTSRSGQAQTAADILDITPHSVV